MNTNGELDNLFEEIKACSLQAENKVYGTGLWKLLHKLAEAKYQPAKEFFIQGLDDPRWDWRRESISLLGFHYQLEPPVVEKIRRLVIHDPDSGARIAAASVLGSQGEFPEDTLVKALILDPDKLVKKMAFSSLLELAGIPYKIKSNELAKVDAGKINPNLEQIRRILSDLNHSSALEALNKAALAVDEGKRETEI